MKIIKYIRNVLFSLMMINCVYILLLSALDKQLPLWSIVFFCVSLLIVIIITVSIFVVEKTNRKKL